MIIFIELRIGQMTSGILDIDLSISFLKRYQILRDIFLILLCQKEDNLCDEGSDNHANVRNSGRLGECLSWKREGREI